MSPFLFIAGTPAVDFVNTEIVSEGERVDLLQTEADVRRWVKEAGLALSEAEGPPARLRQAKELRKHLRALFLRGKPRKNEIDAINAALARGRGSFRLERKGGAYRTRFAADSDDPLFLIAAAAAELIATGDLSLIKPCGGTQCILLFYDTTKSHTRRWCSMAGCGNRMKAALHYQRSREGRE
jgi:predicted RNA-binding Zn ribbon-like protein